MADTFGAVHIPVDAPPFPSPPEFHKVGSVSDPLLDALLSYLQAVCNAHLGAAWRRVFPNGKPVLTTGTNDPGDPGGLEFNEKDLPCLYAFRDGGKGGGERIAEDFVELHDDIHLLWVFPKARQPFRAFRGQIVAGFTKVVMAAITIGRDPAWIVDAELDPAATADPAADHDRADARRWGSNFPRIAGFSTMMMTKWDTRAVKVGMDDGPGSTGYFPALHILLEVTEVMDEDLGKWDLNGGVDVTEVTEDGLLVTDHAILT